MRHQTYILCALLIICCCLVANALLTKPLVTRWSTRLFNKTPLVAGGKRFEAEPGTPLLTACKSLGLNVPTKCKKGECGTCTVSVGGYKYKACVAKVPPAPKLKSLIEKGLAVAVDN